MKMEQSRIWFSSDYHLQHAKPFIYTPRGFLSVEEMNQAIIANHNNCVKPNDDVYLLGDILLGELESGLELLTQLNGRIHLIRGNHDTDTRWAAYQQLPNIVEQQNSLYLKYKKYHFYLSHFPTLCSNYDDRGLRARTINLCGHSHTTNKFTDMDKGVVYHVELDAHQNKPILLDDIIKDLQSYWIENIGY